MASMVEGILLVNVLESTTRSCKLDIQLIEDGMLPLRELLRT